MIGIYHVYMTYPLGSSRRRGNSTGGSLCVCVLCRAAHVYIYIEYELWATLFDAAMAHIPLRSNYTIVRTNWSGAHTRAREIVKEKEREREMEQDRCLKWIFSRGIACNEKSRQGKTVKCIDTAEYMSYSCRRRRRCGIWRRIVHMVSGTYIRRMRETCRSKY